MLDKNATIFLKNNNEYQPLMNAKTVNLECCNEEDYTIFTLFQKRI